MAHTKWFESKKLLGFPATSPCTPCLAKEKENKMLHYSHEQKQQKQHEHFFGGHNTLRDTDKLQRWKIKQKPECEKQLEHENLQRRLNSGLLTRSATSYINMMLSLSMRSTKQATASRARAYTHTFSQTHWQADIIKRERRGIIRAQPQYNACCCIFDAPYVNSIKFRSLQKIQNFQYVSWTIINPLTSVSMNEAQHLTESLSLNVLKRDRCERWIWHWWARPWCCCWRYNTSSRHSRSAISENFT